VLTTLRYFEHEFQEHIAEHQCAAGVCRELIDFWIDPTACTGCGACARSCPVECISGDLKQPHAIDAELCIRCGSCRSTCKFGAVVVKPRTVPQSEQSDLVAMSGD
jgi:NAD-dependent dihydropyrimidine dehydrogenase PreA subunit